MPVGRLSRVTILLHFIAVLTACDGGKSGSASNSGTEESYFIGGSVYDLHGGLVLSLNGEVEVILTDEAEFLFPNALAKGAAYNVSIVAQPEGQHCSIDDQSGEIGEADELGIEIRCIDVTLQWRARGAGFRADGAVDESENHLVFNARTNEIRYTLDTEGDGSPDRIETWRYNELGQAARHTIDEDADGILEEVEKWIFDINGNQTDHIRMDGDGKIRFSQTQSYDEKGYLTKRLVDGDGNGNPDSTETWSYDDRGNAIELYQEFNGIVRSVWHWSFDNNNNVTQQVLDLNADDSPDQIETWTYDDNKLPLSYTRVNRHGDTERREMWQYNSHAKPLSLIIDNGSDGGILQQKMWTYDSNGKQITYSHDYNGDGKADINESWEYDNGSRVVLHSVDSDGDGVSDSIEHWSYDSAGNKASYKLGDGAFSKYWRYDTDGALVSVTTSYNVIEVTDMIIYQGYGGEPDFEGASYAVRPDIFDIDNGTPSGLSRTITETLLLNGGGIPARYTLDWNGDGEADQVSVFSLDDNPDINDWARTEAQARFDQGVLNIFRDLYLDDDHATYCVSINKILEKKYAAFFLYDGLCGFWQ